MYGTSEHGTSGIIALQIAILYKRLTTVSSVSVSNGTSNEKQTNLYLNCTLAHDDFHLKRS